MRLHDLPQRFRIGGVQAADEVTGFFGSAVLAFADGHDSNNAGELILNGHGFPLATECLRWRTLRVSIRQCPSS